MIIDSEYDPSEDDDIDPDQPDDYEPEEDYYPRSLYGN
jgi:hypothetical protein